MIFLEKPVLHLFFFPLNLEHKQRIWIVPKNHCVECYRFSLPVPLNDILFQKSQFLWNRDTLASFLLFYKKLHLWPNKTTVSLAFSPPQNADIVHILKITSKNKNIIVWHCFEPCCIHIVLFCRNIVSTMYKFGSWHICCSNKSHYYYYNFWFNVFQLHPMFGNPCLLLSIGVTKYENISTTYLANMLP